MADFEIDTGWSVFDIYLDSMGDEIEYSIHFGSEDTLLEIRVSDYSEIQDISLIYVDRIYQKDTSLPRTEGMKTFFQAQGPDWSNQGTRMPLWINLHPRTRELELIFAPACATDIRADLCYTEGRIELFLKEYELVEPLDGQLRPAWDPVCIRVTDLTDEEYEYLRQFVLLP